MVGIGVEHGGQVVLYFLAAAAGQQRYHGTVGRKRVCLAETVKSIRIASKKIYHFISRGIANIMYRIIMFSLIKRNLERQDGEHLVNITLDILYPVFLPGPYLGRNIIIDGNVRMRSHVLGNAEIETGIVYENDNVRPPGHNVTLTERHVTEYCPKMQ